MPEVLLLGDPRLRVRSSEVASCDARELGELAATLEEFRRQHGFGRAISAPQIGIARRFIAVNLGKGTFFVVNPVITWRSEETFTMWDDCMSFPDLLVRVERNHSLSLEYLDEDGRHRE
ncbi:MAG: peptide deformylase, partial [Thermoanaerobaculia bacterium]